MPEMKLTQRLLSRRGMVKIKMPMISNAVLIMAVLINKRLHLKSDNYSHFHPQVGHSQLTGDPRDNLGCKALNST